MMRVGIIGAMDVEVTSIKERMTIEKIEQTIHIVWGKLVIQKLLSQDVGLVK